MERKESRLTSLAVVELSDRSMKKDLDSGDEVKGSMVLRIADVSSGLKHRIMLTRVFRGEDRYTHPPLGADGV